MRKKISMLMFAFVAFLFMGAVTVNAETISEVIIESIVEPVEGSLPIHDSGSASPHEAMFVGPDAGFYKNIDDTDLMYYMDPFVEGETVYYEFILVAGTNYEFAPNVKFMYKGTELSSNRVIKNEDSYKVIVEFTVAPLIYNVTDGNNLSTKNLDELVFKINADYSKFQNGGKVYVDGHELETSEYNSESGSTIIALTEEYARGLAVGERTLRVAFTDGGEATTTFTIESQTNPVINTGDTPVNPVIENPQTGDSITLSIIFGIMSLMGIAGVTLYNKKRFN